MKKVLVVEDNEENLYLIRFILEKIGCVVVNSSTGLQGIQMAIKERPDLILMDIQLPDIDGLETVKRIRKLEADGTVPIVAVTSYAMLGDREKALAAGCTDYIEKPIDPETFIEKIKKFF
ncbi:MAG: response regulator [Desulfobacterales bacterium]